MMHSDVDPLGKRPSPNEPDSTNKAKKRIKTASSAEGVFKDRLHDTYSVSTPHVHHTTTSMSLESALKSHPCKKKLIVEFNRIACDAGVIRAIVSACAIWIVTCRADDDKPIPPINKTFYDNIWGAVEKVQKGEAPSKSFPYQARSPSLHGQQLQR